MSKTINPIMAVLKCKKRKNMIGNEDKKVQYGNKFGQECDMFLRKNHL
jgi:hypothetical protein